MIPGMLERRPGDEREVAAGDGGSLGGGEVAGGSGSSKSSDCSSRTLREESKGKKEQVHTL